MKGYEPDPVLVFTVIIVVVAVAALIAIRLTS